MNPSVRRKSWLEWKCMLVAFLLIAVGCSWFHSDLEPLTGEEWAAVVEAHKGRLLVVNVWASWCRSCLEFFPSVVDLAKQYEPTQIQVLSLSIDDLNDSVALEQAQQFLDDQDADFPHYLLAHNITRALESLDLESIPAVMVYDAEGRLRHRLQGDDDELEISTADLEGAIESLIEPTESPGSDPDGKRDTRGSTAFPSRDHPNSLVRSSKTLSLCWL